MSQHNPKKGCIYCERQVGLPIFPVRYAVARQGLGNAPKCFAPFDPTACGGAQKANLELPVSTANDNKEAPFTRGGYYTNRLLRGGYLYAYVEHLEEWQSYFVMDEGVLYPFKRGDKPPKGKLPNVKSCSGEGCKETHHLHKFIYVQDADNATNVWLAFSDAPWTEAVWKQYDSAAFRKKHMRKFDVAKWRSNTQQSHVDGLDALDKRVAEYATTRKALYDETVKYINKLMPKGWTIDKIRGDAAVAQDNIKGYSKKAEAMLPTVPKLLQSLACSLGENYDAPASAAWQFSSEPFFIQDYLNEDFVELVTRNVVRLNNDLKPAMVGLDDPAGIAMDLNGLMIQQIAEVTSDPEYHWKQQTAAHISMLRDTVRQSGITKESHSRAAKKFNEFYGGKDVIGAPIGITNVPHGPMAMVQMLPASVQKDYQPLMDSYWSEIAKASELSPSEAKQAADDAWSDYTNRYSQTKLNDFLGYQKEDGSYVEGDSSKRFKKLTKPLADLLDKPYVAWLDSQVLTNYFVNNFDSKHVESGMGYALLSHLLVNEACGRSRVMQFVTKSIAGDPTDKTQWPLRALFGNQDQLVQATQQVLSDAKSYDAGSTQLAKGIEKLGTTQRCKAMTEQIASYLHQISGAVIFQLTKQPPQSWTEKDKSLVLLTGAIAKGENPDLKLVTVKGHWSAKQAAYTLAHGLDASASQQSGLLNNPEIRKAIEKANKQAAKDFAFQGILLVGQGVGLAGAIKATGLDKAFQHAKVTGFQEAMEDSIGKIKVSSVRGAAVGGIFSAISLVYSCEQLANAPAKATGYARANFASGLASMLGSISEGVGKAARIAAGRMEGTTFRALLTNSARGVKYFDMLELGGRALGALGGVVAGWLLVSQGLSELGDNLNLGALHIVEGGALMISALVLLFSTTGVGIIIGLVIALVVAIIQFITNLLESDELQIWLNRSHYFGAQKVLAWWHFQSDEDHTPYASAVEQRKALINKVLQGA